MMNEDDFESRVLAFEQAWQIGQPRAIADLLNLPPMLVGEDRLCLLVELICVDLEFRWKGQPPACLEDYAAMFPEVGSFNHLPIDIIGEEYRVRCQWGDRPTHSHFLLRFTSRRDEIQAELSRIDSELRKESTDTPGRMAAPETMEALVDQDLGVPLLRHDDVLLQRMIGAGSTGKVYQAWRHSEKRSVAVKFLRKSFIRQPGIVRRFIAEAKFIAGLQHPNIVGIHGLGRTPGGSYFIVMDLILGANLDLLIKTRVFSIAEAIRWLIEACQAIEHAHSRGIIHCDLKPANLMLDEDGRIRVTDFGLSRSLDEPASWIAQVEGTAPYMAPEQASRCWGKIDERTDVYGIGAVLYALVTGRPPWNGQRLPDILADVVSGVPVVPPSHFRHDLPVAINDLCRKCLAKAPRDRYRTVHEVRLALNQIADDL
jgi:eukaryotic-like serine/threonine-protein kinase